MDKLSSTQLIAFYLPQFHPIPENDAWWGKGFTEWTNVAKAIPLYKGHYQPRIPADLGYYDLRLPEVRLAQAELARQYGINGFCYWHYWFSGKRLLERPFDEVLHSGQPNFPFCLAWANEPWSRRWMGDEKQLLLPQTYSEQDDLDHIHWLVTAFTDTRYIKIRERPLFVIYRPTHLPNPLKTTDLFRQECVRIGITEPYLIGIDAWCRNVDLRKVGFDGILGFEPQLGSLPDFTDSDFNFSKLKRNAGFGIFNGHLKIYDYLSARSSMVHTPNFPLYPSIFVGWDNTPRRGADGHIIINATPENFEAGLRQIISSTMKRPVVDRLIFINAWNEWAEGNYLEPDMVFGHQYLETVRRVSSQVQ